MLCGVVLKPVDASAKDFTVVIDPGHGGKDHGAPGKKTNEKSINLSVANKLTALIKENMPEVKVVQTRVNDSFVTLQGRADIANKASGDLFISIHTNSIDKKAKNHSTVSGASVYTLGFRRSEENLAVAMRENEVMKLESDYSTVYEGFDPSSTESYIIFEMSQNKHMEQSILAASAIQKELVATAGRQDRGVRQANFWVLFKTGMPAILVELDFICNPDQEKFMASESGQNKLAKAIYNGLVNYKRAADNQHKALQAKAIETKAAEAKAAEAAASDSKTIAQATKSTADKPAEPATKKAEPSKAKASTSAYGKDGSQLIIYSDFTIYKIQFLQTPASTQLTASSPKLKGLTGVEYTENDGVKKYYVGGFYTYEEAKKYLADVRKHFSDAFIVKATTQSHYKPLGSDGKVLNMPMGRPKAEYDEAPRLLAQARAEARAKASTSKQPTGNTAAKETATISVAATPQAASAASSASTATSVAPAASTSTTAPATKATEGKTSAPKQSADTDQLIYKIQFLISPRRIQDGSPKLKGIKDYDYYIDIDDNMIKYTTGEFKSTNEAIRQLREVRKLFKDAFIIKTKNGRRIK